MAQHTIVTMVDDITGEPGEDVKSFEFAIDGKAYEIDLSEASAGAFRETFAPYVTSARRATVSAPRPGAKRSGGKVSSNPDKARNQAARAWALSQGREVAERGRLGRDVIEAWEAAGSPMPSGEQAPAASTPSEATPVDSSTDATAAPVAVEQVENGEAPKRTRKGRAASTTPTRPDAAVASGEFEAAQS